MFPSLPSLVLLPLLTNALAVPTNITTPPPSSGSSSDPVVHLSYASYAGFHNASSNLDVFLGIRFAAPPTGQLRWAAAQEPADETDRGLQQAKAYPKQCPQATTSAITNSSVYDPLQEIDDEDCLFLNVHAPANSSGKNLPVLVWIHGGGWDHNSVQEFDPTPLILSSNSSFIAITIQYRLGLFGFLQSPQMRPSNGLNAGITDARFALQWTQKYAHLFGGDKTKVTVWGQSSGGGTVLHLVGAEEGRKEKLFRSSVVSSPYLVPMGSCDQTAFENQFLAISSAANCTNDLACLRNTSTSVLRTLNNEFLSAGLQPGHPSAYEPCMEGKGGYLTRNTAELLVEGKVAGKYAFAGSNTRDGFGFAGKTLTIPSNSTNFTAQSDALLSAYLNRSFPLSAENISTVMELYPLEAYPIGQERGGAIFQDAVFACPSNWLARAFPKKSYRYLYAVTDALHARDNAYEFPYTYNTLSPYSPTLYTSFIGAITSFVRSSPPSPNALFSDRAQLEAEGGDWPAFFDDGKKKHGGGEVAWKTLNVSALTNSSTSYVERGVPRVGLGSEEKCAFWAKVRVEGGW